MIAARPEASEFGSDKAASVHGVVRIGDGAASAMLTMAGLITNRSPSLGDLEYRALELTGALYSCKKQKDQQA
jgi:hypothetical protein